MKDGEKLEKKSSSDTVMNRLIYDGEDFAGYMLVNRSKMTVGMKYTGYIAMEYTRKYPSGHRRRDFERYYIVPKSIWNKNTVESTYTVSE